MIMASSVLDTRKARSESVSLTREKYAADRWFPRERMEILLLSVVPRSFLGPISGKLARSLNYVSENDKSEFGIMQARRLINLG